jgi:hypothetical protein
MPLRYFDALSLNNIAGFAGKGFVSPEQFTLHLSGFRYKILLSIHP